MSDDVWGGAEAVVRTLLEAQAKDPALSVSLLALNDGRLAREARALGLEVEVAPESGRGFLALRRDVGARLARRRPSVVHSHRYKENLLSYLTAPRHGARCVVTLHGEEAPESLALRVKVALRRRLVHFVARRAGARFAAVSDDLRRRIGLPEARCVVIPNGVAVPPEPLLREPARRSGAAVVGWIGRFVPIKDVPLLLDAVARLRAPLDATRVLLVGDGPERDRVAGHAERLGLGARVTFTGFVERPAEALREMDVFVLPSRHEGAPVALLEAMAAGIPCVAAAVGGIPALDGGRDAIVLVASREPSAWTAALASLLEDPVRAAGQGARGRERVRAHFSREAAGEAYRRLYRAVLSPSTGG